MIWIMKAASSESTGAVMVAVRHLPDELLQQAIEEMR
jgi:hypothetical protein